MLEKTLEKKIVEYLKARGFYTWKVHGSAYQRAGLPDIQAIRDGKLLWLEIKAPGKKHRATALQLATIRKLQAHGVNATVVDDLETVKQIVENMQ